MINSLISVGSLATGALSVISGIKQAKRLENLEHIISKLDADVQKLSDKVLYLPTFQDVQDINRLTQQTLRDNTEIRQVLIETQRAIGGVLLSSAIIPTPYKMRHALSHDPREVFLDAQPLEPGNFGVSHEGLVPILFPYNGIYYLGWQLPGVLPLLFDCIYTPSVLTSVDQKAEHEFSRKFNFGKITEMIVDASGVDIIIEKTNEPNCDISLYGDSEQLHKVDVRHEGHRLNLYVIASNRGISESVMIDQGEKVTINNSTQPIILQNGTITASANVVPISQPLIKVKVHTGDLSRFELTNNLHALVRVNVDINHASISMMGSGEISLTTVSRLLARITGSGTILADRVKSTADLLISGSGDIRIHNGQLDRLLAQVSGSGSIIADVQTKDAVATLTGSGEINIRSVSRMLQKSNTGSGSIHIGTHEV